MLLRWATTEHTGESGDQLSVGIDMEAYGDRQQLQVTNFGASLGRNPVIK